MEKLTLTRKELYDLIWSEPMLAISRKYKISDTGLRKMCVRLRIPTPHPGYWRQLERGRNPTKPPLGRGRTGHQTSITLTKRTDGESLISPFVMLRDKIKSDHSNEIKVPNRLAKAHKQITEASDVLLGDSDEHKRSLRNEGLLHNYGGLKISVAPINIRYALRLLNSIINLFLARGHQIEGSDIVINGNKWTFSLTERIEKIQVTSYQKQFKPTGAFTFKVERYPHTHRWHDSERARIDSKLADILATVELEAAALEEEQERGRKFQEERRERERIEFATKQRIEKEQSDFKKLQEKELAAFKKLAESAELWFKARIMRDYVNDVTRKVMSRGTMSEELIDWIVWAKKKCNWYDPLINAKDELMDGIDKINLTTAGTEKKGSHY